MDSDLQILSDASQNTLPAEIYSTLANKASSLSAHHAQLMRLTTLVEEMIRQFSPTKSSSHSQCRFVNFI